MAICGEERVAFPAPGVIAELEGLAGLPERKLATLRALAQAALQGTLDGERLRALGGDAAVEELQRLPGVGPFTAQGIVVRGAGEPDYLATAEPRMARAAALAYGLDAPARRPRSWPAAPRRGARTARGCGVLLRLGRVREQLARSRGARAGAERPLPSIVQARQPRRERQPVEESPDTTGQGGRETDPGKPAGKCHRNTPPMAEPLQSPAQARLKWCGKSAPASRRRGGWANPTRCKAKQDRSQAARRGPGRPQRWMAVHDRIRLTGLLRKSPAHAGLFYGRAPRLGGQARARSSSAVISTTSKPTPPTVSAAAVYMVRSFGQLTTK